MTVRKRASPRRPARRASKQRGSGFMDSLRNVGTKVYDAVWKPESEQEKLRKRLLDFKPVLPLTVNKSSQKAGVRRRRSRGKSSRRSRTKRKGGHVWSNLSAGRGVNGNMTVFKYNPKTDSLSSKTTPDYNGMKINTDWEVSHIYNRKSGQILFGFHEAISTFLEDIKVTEDMIREAVQVANRVGMVFPVDLWRRVVLECDGRPPLKVEALPEGTYCPAGTPFAQVSNTVEGFGELVTYWEAIFLHCHFSSSCATEAWKMRKYLDKMRIRHNYPDTFMQRFINFGFRGHRSLEDAMWAGSAWALFLESSDDLHIAYHRPEAKLSSIPALAHKVVSQYDEENDSFFRAIDYAHEIGAPRVALVIDTYDVYRVINQMTVSLAKYAKERGVHIVLRPDSGDTWKQAVDIHDVVKENQLANVSVVIGESMNLENAKKGDTFFRKNNVPLTFISYGIGAGFYKHLERDTLGFAMKTAYSNSDARMKFSGDALKRSTPGIVALYKDETGELIVGLRKQVPDEQNLMSVVYNFSGGTCPIPNFDSIRDIARAQEGNQKYIKSSEAIKEMIKNFRDKYIVCRRQC